MTAQWGTAGYRYELVENWPQVEIQGVSADVAGDSEGRIYAVVRDPKPDGSFGDINPGSGHMLVFDRDGRLLEKRDELNFSSPHGLWINSDDEIFHADCAHHTVTKYSLSGETLMTLGTQGQTGAPGEPFNMCTRATQSNSGDIFVSDGYGQNRVHRFDSDGNFILSFGSGDPVFIQEFRGEEITGVAGTGPGEFNLVHHVMVDDDDNVYVMDRTNNRCQIFDIEGNYLREWSDVRGANDAVIDRHGVMHIVGAAGVELRTLDGELLGRWGEKGEGPGHFTKSPHGVFIDDEESIYVAEVAGNNRLQKFARK
jgi:DNA-binding beta-propeller fold protein YncE